MVTSAVGAIVMAGVLAAYIFLGRSLARLSSYQALETESRKAMAYLTKDFTQAKYVKRGTTPTDSQVTLTLPSGDVTYTYNSSTKTLTRAAPSEPITSFKLLQTDACQCTTFKFKYYTGSDGSPTDLVSASAYVPYSIKQIQVCYTVESPSSWTPQTRSHFEIASSRYVLRNRGATDGS
jgi:hypothetical protein